MEDRRLLSATLQSEWAFLVGGDTRGVALDRDGNVFTVGTFSGAVDFDPGPQVKSLMSLGSDAFVAKYSPSGALLWVTGFGSPSQDIAFGVAVNEFVDDFGNEFVNVYATGTFWETVDFDPLNEHPLDPSTGLPSDTLTSAGDRDVFFLKLNGDDGSFQWVRRAGGTGYDQPMASLAVDKLGNIYGTGFVSSEVADFGDHDIYTAPTDSWLATNCYVTKLDPAGTFSWASNYEIVDQGGLRRGRIAVDDRLDDATQWSVVTTGGFGGTVDFGKDEQGQDVIGTASNPTDQEWALFVLKLNPETGRVRSLLQTDVAELMHGVEVAVDESGNVLIAGQFAGSADFNPAPDQDSILQSVGGADAFVLKLDRDGNFGFAKRFGGVGDDMAYALAIDPLGNIYLSGWFSETADLDPDPAGDFLMTSRGGRDIFVVKLDPTGTFDEARRAGGADSDSGVGIVADPKQNVYVTGQFFSDAEGDFDSEPAEGHGGGFVWKLSPMRMRVAALSDLTTTESGDSASFDVWLSEPPTADVTITLHSSDTSEGTVSPTALLFTPGNYSTPQRVTVTGVDDPDRDGNVAYTIAFDPASSLDANFHGTQARAVVVTNVDSETITETFLNDTPMAIADAKGKNSSLTTSQLTIPAHGTIVDLNVRLDIRHRLSDLSVYLVSPDGTQVELFSGLAGNDFIGTLDDEASFPVTNIVSPRNDYQPEELLSAFDSKEFSGTWTLKIYDSDRLGTGALNSWSLTAVYVPPAPEISIADRTVTEGDDGTVEAVFTLTRSGDTSGEVSVNLATADGSATTAGS
ncbi:MAG: proprotein convertase P-domain-containing protein, partial [Pirellulales bacterium]|nr:proprotein convertase P-domain-containing protein [Pirellulales bacterium]